MNSHFLECWQRELERGHKQGDQDGEDRNDGHLDDEHDEWRCAGRGLQPSGVTQSATDKVPEEFAVEYREECRPQSIKTRGDGDKARIFMPHEVAHCCSCYGVVDRVGRWRKECGERCSNQALRDGWVGRKEGRLASKTSRRRTPVERKG